jgi:predicted Holliday junction resolvase-like endonuclease
MRPSRWPMLDGLVDLLAHSPVLLASSAGAAGFFVGALVVGARALLGRRRAVREAMDRMRPVLKGKIAEQLAPHLAQDFVWSAADARFLGDPIDYVVFDGYADGDEVEVVLVEIKTQNASMSAGQRRIRRAVEAGRVRFVQIRM